MKKIFLGLSSVLFIVSSAIGMHSGGESHQNRHTGGTHLTEFGSKLHQQRKRSDSLPVIKHEQLCVSGDMEERFVGVAQPKTRKKSYSLPVTKKEIDEVMHILKKDDFLAISPEEANEIKSISFEGIEIDYDFSEHFRSIIENGLESIIFKGCRLASDCRYSDLFDYTMGVTNLEIVDCKIRLDDLNELLYRTNPHSVRTIRLSGNDLGKYGLSFEEILKKRVFGRMCLDKLDLIGEVLGSDFIQRTSTLSTFTQYVAF